MAVNGYKFIALTGGGAGSLDSQDGTGLNDGDVAIVMTGTQIYFYQLDDDSGAVESAPDIIAPDSNGGNKRWILQRVAQENSIPIGSITAWVGGYFADGNNGGFVNVLGNDIAAANSYLNGNGWYVCDGSELNLSGSPIYNGAGRHLPWLTDARFIMGASQITGGGGDNTNSHYHGVNISGFISGATTLTTNQMPPHSHSRSSVNSQAGGSETGPQYYTTKAGSTTYLWSGSNGSGQGHTHWIDPPNTNTGGPNVTENRPKFLTCFYIQKVI